jgi:hypothetical protein
MKKILCYTIIIISLAGLFNCQKDSIIGPENKNKIIKSEIKNNDFSTQVSVPVSFLPYIPLPSDVRGLSFDGTSYYVGVFLNKAVQKYDLQGNLVYTFSGNGAHFGHGVATDGSSLWVTSYSDSRVHRYDLTTGNYIGNWSMPNNLHPIRMCHYNDRLWITTIDTKLVYEMSKQGEILNSFPVADDIPYNSIPIAYAGNNSLWVARMAKWDADKNLIMPGRLYRYSLEGILLETVDNFNCFWVIATDDTNPSAGIYHDDINRVLKYTPFILPTPTPIVLDATVTINPETLNVKSAGNYITCYIELPDEFSVSDIAINTILLNDTISAELQPAKIGDDDNDGVKDLMVKFKRGDVIQLLQTGTVTVSITGKLHNETKLINIIQPKEKAKKL